MDADSFARVVGAALHDELWTGPGRDDRSILLPVALGAGHLGNIILVLPLPQRRVPERRVEAASLLLEVPVAVPAVRVLTEPLA